MKRCTFILLPVLCIIMFLHPAMAYSKTNTVDTVIYVPAGGNTWCTECSDKTDLISNEGIQNWVSDKTGFETYFRVDVAGTVRLNIKAKTDVQSVLLVSIGAKSKQVTIKGKELKTYDAGNVTLTDTGYIKISIRAKQKRGAYFADIPGFELSGSAINSHTAFVKNNEGNFFYWGRRGPSVHLSYPFADSIKASWFYNEVTVPEGQDIEGSYFMADGFGEGYFGMQVNSANERRVLFSVWSPYTTDDPKTIPADMRIALLKKGEDVYTGEFGNEGSGGQSYLRFNWKAGVTYKFLLHGLPDGNGNTIYTAYFFAPETEKWMLIASFKRPKTNTYLKKFHSFLENFIPAKGNITRKVYFGNQWVCDNSGKWIELTNAVFTYDNTAAKKYRMDYAGGSEQGKFYLKNCGFFNAFTAYRSLFYRNKTNKQPDINFSALP